MKILLSLIFLMFLGLFSTIFICSYLILTGLIYDYFVGYFLYKFKKHRYPGTIKEFVTNIMKTGDGSTLAAYIFVPFLAHMAFLLVGVSVFIMLFG